MKDFSRYLQTTCHGTNSSSIHSKGSKFATAFCWLANDLSRIF